MRFFSDKYTYLRIASVILVCAMFIPLCSCAKQSYVDPYEGMVSVCDGRGGEMWAPLYDNLQVSSFSSDDFYSDGEFVDYKGIEYTALRGIDVSEHQGEINWQAVRDDGVEFAIIRAGYRGYSEGKLREDAFFRKNIEGALAAGLKVGVYFFSQAVDTEEASEEARYLLSIISDYDLSLPVFYDWERVSNVGETRTDTVSGSTITDCCLAFCDIIEETGYEAGVYFFRGLGYHEYELGRLSELVLWVGAPGDSPDFYYKHRIWQYSYTGKVNGIEKETDLNILFEESDKNTVSAAPSIVPGEIPPPEVTMPDPSDIRS
ncbi:MAG: glycoside hydrolase [Clostridiales bacterium]|jgi:lysozyme|nr:glycoside hydrolase [Clostridiales bacterium]